MTRLSRQHMYGGGGFPILAENISNEDVSSPFTATMPAAVDADDLLILFVHRDAGTGGPSGTPSGWTSLVAATEYAVYYKWAAGTEGGTSITVSSTGSPSLFFTVLRITGADSAQNPQMSTVATASSAAPNPPAVDPSWADANNLFIAMVGFDAPATVSVWPTGYDLNQQTDTGTTGSSHTAAKTSLSSASEDPAAFTLSATNDWYAFTLAVKGT